MWQFQTFQKNYSFHSFVVFFVDKGIGGGSWDFCLVGAQDSLMWKGVIPQKGLDLRQNGPLVKVNKSLFSKWG